MTSASILHFHHPMPPPPPEDPPQDPTLILGLTPKQIFYYAAHGQLPATSEEEDGS